MCGLPTEGRRAGTRSADLGVGAEWADDQARTTEINQSMGWPSGVSSIGRWESQLEDGRKTGWMEAENKENRGTAELDDLTIMIIWLLVR